MGYVSRMENALMVLATLKHVKDKYKDDVTLTGKVIISEMAKDCIEAIEYLVHEVALLNEFIEAERRIKNEK